MSKGRSKNKAKRSIASIPKGIPQRTNKVNPFEYQYSLAKRPKHDVLNRKLPGYSNHHHPAHLKTTKNSKQQLHHQLQPRTSALARSIERRKLQLATKMERSKKANLFVDKRIGEKKAKSVEMTEEEITLARIVKERVRRSKRSRIYDLDDDNDDDNDGFGSRGIGGGLTHKGKAIDESYTGKGIDEEIIPSDDEDDYYADKGTLDKADTEMHFGGGSLTKQRQANNNPYGRQQPNDSSLFSLGDVYRSRKEEMDEMIKRKKLMKLEKQKSKEVQVDKFEALDDNFKELASLLQFRDKDQEYKQKLERKEKGLLTEVEKEMDEWDREMKTYQFERKVAATDRTKTPEEIAKEEAERLHELETKRLARMNGDFENDDLSDVSDNEEDDTPKNRKKRKLASKAKDAKSKKRVRGDDELDSESEDEDETNMKFTSEGLVYTDKHGNTIPQDDGKSKKDQDSSDDEDDSASENSNDDNSVTEESDIELGGSEDDASNQGDNEEEEDSDDDLEDKNAPFLLKEGTKIQGNYHASEQFGGQASWYPGTITRVYSNEKGNTVYDVTYDDGDFEDGMIRENLKVIGKTKEQKKEDEQKKLEMKKKAQKKRKAKKIARSSMPFVFEVPTTLEALHEMIATHASVGSDASLIIQRIHTSNSVRLNKNNKEKMQNFYDVIIRRFVVVGDKIHTSGDGGPDLGRYEQLNCLTKTLYAMAQDSPEIAGAVWGRRLGILQKALAKRLRDSELVSASGEEEFTAWPSTGTFLLLRSLGHIFPVTDMRHTVVTSALLFIGQTLSQAPVRSLNDVAMGILFSSLAIEYTKEAKRIVPEALAFLAGVIRLFGENKVLAIKRNPVPSLENALSNKLLGDLREEIRSFKGFEEDSSFPQLSLEKDFMEKDKAFLATSIFCSTLKLINSCASVYTSALNSAEADAFSQITLSLLCIKPESKNSCLPKTLSALVAQVAAAVSETCKYNEPRLPLLRRSGGKPSDYAIKSLAPKMEDPSRYHMSKDKGKTQMQAELDRNRREYKREHKAVKRELRLDASFVESERRKEKERNDTSAKEKRHKNFAWLEQEQATMNQQVRLGGGLLKGGGTGSARSKAATGKLGIKKGGKFRS